MTVPITPHPCQHLVLSVFFLTVIPLAVKWYLIVVLICMSLMANDIEYLFTCLLAICISSLEKCVFTLPILELFSFFMRFFSLIFTIYLAMLGITVHMLFSAVCRLSFFVCYFVFCWLHWVFIAACGLSLVAASRGYSSLLCAGLSLWWLLLLCSTGSRVNRLSCP